MANRIILELLADSNGLLKNLDRAQQSVDKFVDASRTAGQSLGGGVNRALDAFTDLAKGGASAAGVLAGGLVAAATAAVMMTLSVGKQIEAVDQLSQKTGISIQTLQGWSVIMAENGFQAESLTAGMRTLAKQMIEARNPASVAASTFEEMGISIRALGSTDAVIRAVADRFKDMPDGADKARLAVQLFGKAGLEMIPMLNRGAAAFDESRRASERFGLVLTTSQVAALNAADDASDRLGSALNGLKTQFAVTLAPSVTSGANAITEAIARITAAVKAMREESERSKNAPLTMLDAMKSLIPGSSLIEAGVRAVKPPPTPTNQPDPFGPDQNEQVIEYLNHLEDVDQAMVRLRDKLIAQYQLTVASGHAQESLGRVTIAILQREQAERNNVLALAAEQADAVSDLQYAGGQKGISKEFEDQLKAVQALMALMPELNFLEAQQLALHNQQAGQGIVDAGRKRTQDLQDTAHALGVAADSEKAYADLVAAEYHRLGPLFGDAAAARMAAYDAIDARLTESTATLDAQLNQGLIGQAEYNAKLLQLDMKLNADRMGVAAQFPTFMEKQFQDLVASNTFSLAQITNNFTSATAQWIMTGQNFAQFWQSLQTTLLQAFLNTLVQMFANWVLHTSAIQAGAAALEAAKTAIFGAGETARAGITKATAAVAVASNMAALAGMVALGNGAIAIMTAVMMAASAMMAAIAGALAAGVVTAPLAGPVAAASGMLAAGAATMGATALAAIQGAAGAAVVAGGAGFKDGGIGDFGAGTPATLHGQEAIIPLNGRGAAFMQEAFGGMGGGGQYTQTIVLDGRVLARSVSDQLPSVLRMGGVPA